MLEVLRRPPVREPALRVELAALIVEAVADLVPDRRSHRAVVRRAGARRIEERRLQDRRREVERILQREVDGIDRLRRHPPLGAIHGLMQLRELPVIFEERRPLDVSKRVTLHDVERRVVDPLVRVSDAHIERLHLLPRLGFRFGRHPVELLDPCVEGADQVVGHRADLGLGLRWKMALDVQLADNLAERGARRIDSPLPPRPLFGRAAERLAVERKPLIRKGLGKDAVSSRSRRERQASPSTSRAAALATSAASPVRAARMPGDERAGVLQPGRVEECRPVEPRGVRGQGLPRPDLRQRARRPTARAWRARWPSSFRDRRSARRAQRRRERPRA